MATVVMAGKYPALNVKNNARSICSEIKEHFGVTPTLAVVIVGNDPASKTYVKNKSKACEYIGVNFKEFVLPEDVTFQDVARLVKNLNNAPDIHGILVQSPIGKLSHSQTLNIFNEIDYRKDVDGFNFLNRARLLTNSYDWYPMPCTPMGIYLLLDYYNISISDKHIAIIGRSDIVGKPLACLLENLNATVTLCHSHTNLNDLKEICNNSDIIISAVGKQNFVDASFIGDRTRAIVDVGINRNENGKLCGDVDFDSVKEIFDDRYNDNWLTPVPGGVGLMTVSCLMYNLVKCCERICENELQCYKEKRRRLWNIPYSNECSSCT